MAYSYQKATPQNPHPGKFIPPYLKVLPTIVSAVGLGIVATVVYPIVSYQFKDANLFSFVTDNGLLSPASYESQAVETSGPKVISGGDSTKASTWFPGSLQNDLFATPETATTKINPTAPEEYEISIPTLGIETAKVSLTGEDLTKYLVQYPQTALPGQLGSPVIFGHSTLVQLFDPKNYKAIFSTLPKIKEGSDIFVTYNGIQYTYRVSKKYEVKPSELWVLRQNYQEKTLKVITCVPPGTTLRRLIVEAKLVQN